MFETRDPGKMARLEWNRKDSYVRTELPGVGGVEKRHEVTDVAGDLVSFRSTLIFLRDPRAVHFKLDLALPQPVEVEESLAAAGFVAVEVRDAPDRPGRELVFISRRPD